MGTQQNNQRFQLEKVLISKIGVSPQSQSAKIEMLNPLVALIAGGNSGIGLMATQTLAVNRAKVYITGRTGEKLNRVTELYGKNIPCHIISITSDVTSIESIQKLVNEIESK